MKHRAQLFTALALLTVFLCFLFAFKSLKKPESELLTISPKPKTFYDENADKKYFDFINTADKDTLVKIKGIGKKTADIIIENRPYYYPEDIMLVKGIGEKRFTQIKEFVDSE